MATLYTPEEWVVVKINVNIPHYRVFGSWRGGYTNGDSWRMNSGIVSVEFDGDCYIFKGHSESTYICHKSAYGIRSPYNNSVLASYKSKLQDDFNILKKMPSIKSMNL